MRDEPIRRFLPVAAGAAVVMALHQVFDLQAAAIDLDLATASGRMRLVNTAAARLPAFVVAELLVLLVAFYWPRRGFLLFLIVAHFGLAVVSLALLPEYLSDAAEMASGIRTAEILAYRLLVIKVLGILLVTAAAAFVVGWGLRARLGGMPSGPPNSG